MVTHVDGIVRHIGVLFEGLVVGGGRIHDLSRIVLLRHYLRRQHVLIVGVRILASYLIILQLIILRLGFVVFHINHFVAAIVLVFFFVICWHDVLKVMILVLHVVTCPFYQVGCQYVVSICFFQVF